MLASLAFAVAIPPAEAIPTFAQRYALTCADCHTAVPELNAFGRVPQCRISVPPHDCPPWNDHRRTPLQHAL